MKTKKQSSAAQSQRPRKKRKKVTTVTGFMSDYFIEAARQCAEETEPLSSSPSSPLEK